MLMKTIKILLTLCLTLSTIFSFCQTSEFEKSKWIILSDDNVVAAFVDTVYKGKQSIILDGQNKAIALRKDLNLKNFRIEMDIAGEVMSGLGFHLADEQNYQFIYFRPGLGGTEEAIQYIPIYNGGLSWVFYNYPTYETTAEIKQLEWFHVAIEVRGNNLKVFVNNSTTPQMDVSLLNTEVSGGNVLLRSMFGTSYFSNFQFKSLPAFELTSNVTSGNHTYLRDWYISGQFPRNAQQDFGFFLKEAIKSEEWKMISDPDDNYINLCRYFKFPNGIVVAKKHITTTEEGKKSLHFDFVGKLRIYLNGYEMFNYGRKHRFERVFDGTFSITLNMKKGVNELIFITEGDAVNFGEGWNAMGRLQHQNWGFIAKLKD